MQRPRILIVEDESIIARSIQEKLESLGYAVTGVAASGEQAIRKAAQTQPDLVLMDIRLKGKMDGVEAARCIQASQDLAIVYLTGHADQATLERAKATQPFGYLLKPFELDVLHTTVEMALHKYQIQRTLRQRNQELELLSRASQAFMSTLDLDDVLAAVLDEVRRVLNVVACSAWLIDPHTGDLVCRQVTDPQGDVVRGWRLAPGQGLAGWVVQHGQSLNVADIQTDERHFKGVDRRTGLPLRSMLTVPLRVKDKVAGVIQVVDATVARFDATDVRLLESLASTAAIAIENARLYGALRESEERYRTLFGQANDAIFLNSEDDHILDVNQRACELLGYSREELLRMQVPDLQAPEVRGRAGSVIRNELERYGGVPFETLNLHRDGTRIPVEVSTTRIANEAAGLVLAIVRDIRERKRAEAERERLISELQAALARIKSLSGLIPICAACKKIRDDQGYWQQVEVYIRDHSEAEFSHGLCPDCARRLYPELYEEDGK
jgi:PAS domain S-box-containing protein